MRDIKFRAFDTENKEMLEVQELDYEDSPNGQPTVRTTMYNDYFDTAEMILMQYTGLKDKNGIEIYEGDIVQDYFYEKKAKIIYMEAAFYLDYTFDFIQYGTNHNRYQLISDYDTRKVLEVIGNIYDNPELLGE